MKELVYEEPAPISQEETIAALESDDAAIVADALLRAVFHVADPEWLTRICIHFLRDSRSSVRQMAATCAGHLSAFFRDIDLSEAIPELKVISKDRDIGWSAIDALEEIRMFQKRDRRLRNEEKRGRQSREKRHRV